MLVLSRKKNESIVINNELIASTQLVNGAGTLYFDPLAGPNGRNGLDMY